MMPRTVSFADYLIALAGVVAFVAIVAWFLWRTLKRTEDPPRLIFKWVLTVVVLAVLVRVVMPIVAGGTETAAFIGIPATALVGLTLAIIWRHNIAGLVAKPFGALYDGGDEEMDARPFYSAALACRKRGDLHGARREIRTQLQKFPDDFEGLLLLAALEAEDAKDLTAAAVAIEHALQSGKLAPANIAYALNTLADWHLQFHQDRAAARACFERIAALLPDSEWAMRAQQRIAHLASEARMLEAHDRRRIPVPHIIGDPGLERGLLAQAPAEADPARQAQEMVAHLQQFPHDTEVREKLAQLYADHYQRLDLAQDQLEQLIQFPNQPWRQVVRWLNHLADLQVQHGAGYDAVRATLQRIVDLVPDSGPAAQALNRIEHLPLELKGRGQSQSVKLGTYEDDLGLKRHTA